MLNYVSDDLRDVCQYTTSDTVVIFRDSQNRLEIEKSNNNDTFQLLRREFYDKFRMIFFIFTVQLAK